jgi:DNA topoisomerase VI subunit A
MGKLIQFRGNTSASNNKDTVDLFRSLDQNTSGAAIVELSHSKDVRVLRAVAKHKNAIGFTLGRLLMFGDDYGNDQIVKYNALNNPNTFLRDIYYSSKHDEDSHVRKYAQDICRQRIMHIRDEMSRKRLKLRGEGDGKTRLLRVVVDNTKGDKS